MKAKLMPAEPMIILARVLYIPCDHIIVPIGNNQNYLKITNYFYYNIAFEDI